MTDTHTAESLDAPETPDVPLPTPAEPASGIAAVVRLGVALAAVTVLFVFMGWTNILIIIGVLIAMVVLHEFAHFITAKKSGMKVTEFFVGFGPRLWSVRRGETEYGFKAIPAGGYCRIIGMTSEEELHPSDEPRAYRNQSFWKRIVVASAGSTMHILIALVLAFCALFFIGKANPSVVMVQGYTHLSGGHVTPAQRAGIAPGDRIVAINGKNLTSFTSLSSVVHSSVGKPVQLTVERNGVDRAVTVVPADGRMEVVSGTPLAPKAGPPVGYLGVSLAEGTAPVGFLSAVGSSGVGVWQTSDATVKGIVRIFSPAGIGNYVHQVMHPNTSTSATSGRPESIVGVVRTTAQAKQAGMLALLAVLISINIFLAIMNMLPMLPLDGGHVAIAGYEWIRTRKGQAMYRADVKKMVPFAYAFMAFLVLLVMGSMYLDILHPAANPFH